MARRVAAVGEDPVGEVVQQVLAAGDHDDGGAAAGELDSAAASPMPDDAPVSRMRLPSRSTSAIGPVRHQPWDDRRSHTGQHEFVGQPP